MIFLTRQVLGSCMMLLLAAGVFQPLTPAAFAATQESAVSAPEDFPLYPVIRPNVAFWIDVFTRYSRGEGVVHDARDLSVVYGVIRLNPDNTRKAAQQNRKARKKAIESYKAVLAKLANGQAPATPKEKKVAALFGASPAPGVFERARHNLRIQTGLKHHFMEGVVRSGALLDEFRQIFRSYGLPEDLIYLPCVESSFNTAAYSKFGAAGIWQFTRSTGRRYMKIGYVVDERRDPFLSTHAAAKLLKRNHGELKSWPLALTAYNHGLNGMKRAKKQYKTYPRIHTHYRSRSFKFASRNFYAEFLAAREVAKNYTRYFGDIRLEQPAGHTRFQVKGYVPAAGLAASLGITLDTLQQLNPALRKPVFDGRKYIPKGYELRLPAELARDRIIRITADLYRPSQKPSKFHRVRKGDTAGAIARTHKVSLSDLVMANSLGRRAIIYVGQTLRIPASGEKTAVKKALAKAGPQKTKTVQAATPHKKDPVPASPAMPAEKTAAETPAYLQVVTSDLKVRRLTEKKSYVLGEIHVVPGETLGHYADWLAIPTQRIRTLNKLAFGRPISIGQTIRLPLPKSGPARFEEQRFEYHQEIIEDFFDSYFIVGTESYEIKSGDTLWTLCVNELAIPLWLLQKFNPAMDFKTLRPRQRLVYPLVSPNSVLPYDHSAPPDVRS